MAETAFSDGLSAVFRFQFLPAFQLLQQFGFDFFRPLLQRGGFFVVAEDVGVGELGGEGGLFGFEGGDLVGQRVEFALFFCRTVLPYGWTWVWTWRMCLRRQIL